MINSWSYDFISTYKKSKSIYFSAFSHRSLLLALIMQSLTTTAGPGRSSLTDWMTLRISRIASFDPISRVKVRLHLVRLSLSYHLLSLFSTILTYTMNSFKLKIISVCPDHFKSGPRSRDEATFCGCQNTITLCWQDDALWRRLESRSMYGDVRNEVSHEIGFSEGYEKAESTQKHERERREIKIWTIRDRSKPFKNINDNSIEENCIIEKQNYYNKIIKIKYKTKTLKTNYEKWSTKNQTRKDLIIKLLWRPQKKRINLKDK